MLYYEWPPKWWQNLVGGAGESVSEAVGTVTEELGGLISDKFLDVLRNNMGELGNIIGDGLKGTELKKIFEESFTLCCNFRIVW
jgi:hypothetical protein